MGNPAPVTAAKQPRVTWVRKAAERVPTRWFATILAAVFLLATAAFGSLADAPAVEPPVAAAGELITTPEMSVELTRAVLLDDFPEAYTTPEEGSTDRVIAVLATVTNAWDKPYRASIAGNVGDAIRLSDFPDLAPVAVAIVEDTMFSPMMPPGVPLEMVLTWIVPGDAYAEGTDAAVDVTSYAPSRYSAVAPEFNWRWDPTGVAAVVSVPVEESDND